MDLIPWIEDHPVTISLLTTVGVLAAAWGSGLFRLLRQRVRRPKVLVVPEGSFVAFRTTERDDLPKTGTLAVFLLNVTLINPSDAKAILRGFQFSYRCPSWKTSMRQRLRYVPMPSLPKYETAVGRLIHHVWFQSLPGQATRIDGRLEPKEMENGWIMFVSATWGSYDPRVVNDRVKVKLEATFTDGRRVADREEVRVAPLADLQELLPDIRGLLDEDRWWNLSVKLK